MSVWSVSPALSKLYPPPVERPETTSSANDWATFAGVLAVLTCVAAVAGYVPARRASRLNPLDTLRCD